MQAAYAALEIERDELAAQLEERDDSLKGLGDVRAELEEQASEISCAFRHLTMK